MLETIAHRQRYSLQVEVPLDARPAIYEVAVVENDRGTRSRKQSLDQT